jgi:hypothetical protein
VPGAKKYQVQKLQVQASKQDKKLVRKLEEGILRNEKKGLRLGKPWRGLGKEGMVRWTFEEQYVREVSERSTIL